MASRVLALVEHPAEKPPQPAKVPESPAATPRRFADEW
jgi:hypothetical protein